MARQHPDAPSTVTCIWPAPGLFDEVAQRLLCWATPADIKMSSAITPHYEVAKTLCGTYGALTFTNNGPDQCPLPDDLNITAADPINPTTCESGTVIPGNMTIAGTLFINQPDADTRGLVITQNNPVGASDANMVEHWYQGYNTQRHNEIGLPRQLTPPASTGLGKEGEATAQFHAGTPTSKSSRWFNSNGTEVGHVLGNGTAIFTGNVEAPNTTQGAWLPITIDSTTVPGRYTPASGVTQYLPAASLDGANRVELSGLIVINSASATGDIMASAMPTGTHPAKEVNLVGASGGAAAGIRVSAAGVLTIQRSAQTGNISLDGLSYRRI